MEKVNRKDFLTYQDVEFKTEAQVLVSSRSNGKYREISEDAKAIIETLINDDQFTYFYSQIANKLARIKHGYSVEDSLLDIAGYAELELKKWREENGKS